MAGIVGEGERERLRHGYCAVLGGIDRLAYPVMDARLWLGRANARPPRVRPEPMRRETDRERLQEAFAEIGISYSS